MRARANALVGPVDVVARALAGADRYNGGWILGSLRNFLSDHLLVTQSLVIDSKAEKLVEVEVVLHQEANVARFELHRLISKDFGVRPDVGIERSRSVCGAFGVPLEACDADLKSVHPAAIVL